VETWQNVNIAMVQAGALNNVVVMKIAMFAKEQTNVLIALALAKILNRTKIAMTNEKMPAELMYLCWNRQHVGGLKYGEVECNICHQVYPIREKHPCKASVPTKNETLEPYQVF